MDERKRRGDRGESAVADWLERRGCAILERQYRCRWGEIDLVARDPGGVVCFVEVKTRQAAEAPGRRVLVSGPDGLGRTLPVRCGGGLSSR